MAEHYYTVGVHGAPTPETAPHGFAWIGVADHRWRFASAGHDVHANSTKWYPLPPPPTEQAPAPEPVARWSYKATGSNEAWGNVTWGRLLCNGDEDVLVEDLERIVDVLNALDRDGVAWGPGRPMEELPETGRVMVWLRESDTYYIRKADYISTHRNTYACWWPLPGEAT